ncbi:MAG TPA: T9SS type A sorting domain-containing protein [Ignavibacteria bacterium]|nr:T9SS type A sorting domain-containing protein [Ignavibacteria bacterium]
MKKFLKIIIVLGFLLPVCVQSQAVTWTRYYDPSGTRDFGIDALQMADKGYMILLNSKSGMYILKTDYLGKEIWSKIIYPYGGSYRFLQTSDNGFAICGLSIQNRMILIKTDENGDTLWTKQYTIDGRQSRAWSIKATRDKGFVLCGSVYPHYPNEAYVVKTDSIGNLEWQNTYSTFTATDIVQSTNGNYYSVGWNLLRKIDSLGNEVWIKSTGDALRIIESEDGYLYLGGGSDGFYFAKFDTSGNSIFQNNFFENAGAKDICADTKGNFLLAGSINLVDTLGDNQNAMFAKFNPMGELIFAKSVNTIGLFGELLSSCNLSSDGGYIMCGHTNYPTPGIWEDNVLAIKSDSAGNTSPIVTIKSQENESVRYFELEQNYPNPFNSTTLIKYYIKKPGIIKIVVYDILGKERFELVNSKQHPGSYSIKLNVNDLNSGLYLYGLIVDDQFSGCKKMIVLK